MEIPLSFSATTFPRQHNIQISVFLKISDRKAVKIIISQRPYFLRVGLMLLISQELQVAQIQTSLWGRNGNWIIILRSSINGNLDSRCFLIKKCDALTASWIWFALETASGYCYRFCQTSAPRRCSRVACEGCATIRHRWIGCHPRRVPVAAVDDTQRFTQLRSNAAEFDARSLRRSLRRRIVSRPRPLCLERKKSIALSPKKKLKFCSWALSP